jgi:hypothetical protein
VGAWTLVLMIARHLLFHINHITRHFCFSYYWDSVSLYAQTPAACNLPICVSLGCWDDMHMPPSWDIDWDGSWKVIPKAGVELWSCWCLPPV